VESVQTQPVTEIVVVVDGCDDGTLEVLETLRASDARLRAVWQGNAGAGVARQLGAELATADVVLFLDDDVVAEPGLVLGHALRHLQADRSVVSGYLKTTLPAVRRRRHFATYLYADEYEKACRRYEEDPTEVLLGFWAGNFSLTRNDALRVGMHDPEAPLDYHADTAFGWRAIRAGLVGIFDRSLEVRHEHSRSTRAFLDDARRQGADMAQLDVLAHRYAVPARASDETLRVREPTGGPKAWLTRTPVASELLGRTADVFGALHLWRWQLAAASHARGLAQRHGWASATANYSQSGGFA
jgi:glycosyltransferase involved in cell wall biosynthesis